MQIRKIKELFFTVRWFLLLGGGVLLFLCSFFLPFFFDVAVLYLTAFATASAAEFYFLFRGGGVAAVRIMPTRFSLGDANRVALSLTNRYPFKVYVEIQEQLPFQFQLRNFCFKKTIQPKSRNALHYELTPKSRGVYEFGSLVCYVSSPFRLLQRQIEAAPAQNVKVYPSFRQLRKYQLLALSYHPVAGIKRVHRIGHSMEFEKIKSYVPGDNIRLVNWKATARARALMVNTYTELRQQQVYVLLDKGRTMKMPFDGMTLLDHSINAALCLLNIALLKDDRAGLISFSNRFDKVIVADRRPGQLARIMEALYQQETGFSESDYEGLVSLVQRRIPTRSLLMLFTNFETLSSLERQLPYLKSLARRHLVCVIFFENTGLIHLQQKKVEQLEDLYIQTIGAQFDFEKRQIVKELRRNGLLVVLTSPTHLAVDVLNQYLELKSHHIS